VQTGDLARGICLYSTLERELLSARVSQSWHGAGWRIRDLEAVKAATDQVEFNRLWEVGSRMSLEQALESASGINSAVSS
jgi:hypothetical protein